MNPALPRGFRDILPTEARELHAIERSLMDAFAHYGYVPLEPPTVEFAQGAVTVDERRMLRFLDRDGRLLALRPDITTAIARVVAQRYHGAEGTLRLAYFAPIFREETSMRGSEREYDQAGVELVGDPTLRADAEVIALLADALTACGLPTVEIEVAHVGFIDGFIGELPELAREGMSAAARAGDFVGAVAQARAAGLDAEGTAALERGLRHRGTDVQASRAGAPARSRAALDELDALRPLLDASGFSGSVRFDLGYIPALPYYSGIVFQATVPALGFPVATGGRYDRLLRGFGVDRAATGFGITVPHLHQALVGAGWKLPAGSPLVALAADDRDPAATLGVAAALRSRGIAVAIGDIAEPAGQDVRRAVVEDASHVRYDGGVRSIDELLALLNGASR